MPQMNYQLAEAVIATFRTEDPVVHYTILAKFDYRAWKKTYKWLDASGLALYFLNRVQVLHIEAAIPLPVLQRLQENASDNQIKTKHLFDDFMAINREFKRVGLSYLNLKGFTLAPDAFSETGLRLQLDLDFWVDKADIFRCQQTLEQQGYWLTGEGNDVKEFKAGDGQVPHLRDLYKSKAQRCVEIHFSNSNGAGGRDLRCGRIARSRLRRWGDLELPTLSDRDRLIELALHLFKHLKGEWTRASWILEYANFVNFNEQNEVLWAEVGECALENEEIRLALGVATLISHRNFGIRRVPEVLAQAIQKLPQMITLWIDMYGKKVILAKFPGTKSHLLLRRALILDGFEDGYGINRLFPLHRPARITVKKQNANLLVNIEKAKNEGRYFFFACTSTVSKISAT
jgi:Uncharacterised nucleotidyltransferase